MFCLNHKHSMKRKTINTLSKPFWFNINQNAAGVENLSSILQYHNLHSANSDQIRYSLSKAYKLLTHLILLLRLRMKLIPKIFSQKKSVRHTSTGELVLDGQSIDVLFRPNAKAKRIILRLNKQGDGIALTVPKGTSKRKALEFAASQGVWIAGQLAKQPDTISFQSGQVIPLRGAMHTITASSTRRTPVWLDESDGDKPLLNVSGDPQHHSRRITDWLKKQARNDINMAAHSYADKMGGTIKRISIRDTTSRWGSCSSDGSLSFSWRLILAPSFVLDYVCAHEVAHLLEMNHSDKFWGHVETHCSHTQQAKKWLKTNGRSLHGYGAK